MQEAFKLAELISGYLLCTLTKEQYQNIIGFETACN